MTSKTTNKFSPEIRVRAVRMVLDHEDEHASRWAAVSSIAAKIGCTAQTLNEWVKKTEVESGKRAGLPSDVIVSIDANDLKADIARGFALGRKSWLFAGSERSADRAAVMATLITTAKLNDIDPQAWLADVLARINDHAIHRLDQLLPWNWKPIKGPRKLAA